MATHRLAGIVVGLALALAPGVAWGQQPEEAGRSFFWDVTRSVLIDPTTYAPAAISYTAMLQDWKTSQVLFAHGWMEGNPNFTLSGRANDVPLAYGAGKRLISANALIRLQYSALNNATAGIVERMLLRRYPSRKKLIRIASWAERIGYATVVTYRGSAEHLRQAGTNRRLAREYGYVTP